MPTAPCDLCRTLTPLALLAPEAYQEWDALWPPCWLLATAHTTLERARADATHTPWRGGDPMQLRRATGWFPWIAQDARDIDYTPYLHRQVEIAREEWDIPETIDPRSLDPMTNAVDLWWRPVPQAPDARHRYLQPEERYRHDAAFHQLVDMLECLLHDAKTTPTEIRDACLLALIHHEQKAIRGWVMTRDQTAPWDMRLEPDPPPWVRMRDMP